MRRRASLRKKGALPLYEAVMWIARGLVMVYILLSIKFITGAFIVKNIDTRAADSGVLMNVVYYSEDVALKDAQTGRIYPGIIDASNSATINSFSHGQDGTFLAAKASVSPGGITKSFFYNEIDFNDWNLLYIAGLTKGPGGIVKSSIAKNFIVLANGEEASADGKIEVVSRNA